MFAELEEVFREIDQVTRRELQRMLDTVCRCDEATPFALTAIAGELRKHDRHEIAMKCCQSAVAFDEQHQTEALSRCNSFMAMAECYEALVLPQAQEFWLRKAYDVADKEPLSIYIAYGIADELNTSLRSQNRIAEADEWRIVAETLMTNMVEWAARHRGEK